ncbi:MAG: type II secretion system minor pseudopilin GspJ [Acidiferrobacterales bacterium]|nr:type II secretion system minor pseudopilin GspJ [Acidiferrobacterales bacterium]
MISSYRNGGFTFIEVLVAIGIFAVISSISYATLSQFLKVRDGVEDSLQEMRELQQTFTLFERDFRFMVSRPVRDEYGDLEQAVLFDGGGLEGELIRMTVSEPDVAVIGSSRLRRVGWRLVDGDLYRDSWLVLDRVQDSEPVSRLVLRDVRQVEVLAYEWEEGAGVKQLLDAEPAQLPYAAELLVTLENEREYRRIFDLANGT